ncbi:hypothetical protein TWF481_006048 [Arthrobotrys musiformis]|uniref:Uncharacterized protein n=1 Tax=Arthrobotrys musiformis TaxID=47236 RepID=A0AAV9WH82_9PEZI
MHPWKIALVRSWDSLNYKNESSDIWDEPGSSARSNSETTIIGNNDLVSLRDGISMSYITVLQEDPENLKNAEEVDGAEEMEKMKRQALALQKKPRFNSVFQIEFRDPLDIRHGFRFKSASGCYIASTFFHNKPPKHQDGGNTTSFEFQTGTEGEIITVTAGTENKQVFDKSTLSESKNKDYIAETLRRTTLIGCTYEPKLEISTFRVIDEASGEDRIEDSQADRTSPFQKLNWTLELISAQIRMRQHLRLAVWAGTRGLHGIQTPLILGVDAQEVYFRSAEGQRVLEQTSCLTRAFVSTLLIVISARAVQMQLQKRHRSEAPKFHNWPSDGKGPYNRTSWLYYRELVLVCAMTLASQRAITGSGYFVEWLWMLDQVCSIVGLAALGLMYIA